MKSLSEVSTWDQSGTRRRSDIKQLVNKAEKSKQPMLVLAIFLPQMLEIGKIATSDGIPLCGRPNELETF